MPARIPSYRLHKPSGQAVVTLCSRDHYLGRHGLAESHQAYERLVAEWLANRQTSPEPQNRRPDLTVNELLLAYWEHVQRYYVKDGRPTSEPDTIHQALRPVRELYGDSQAIDFGPLALKAVRQAMIRRNWCRGFINQQIGRIKRMFSWAAGEELVPVAVHQALKTVDGLQKDRSDAREKPGIMPVADEVVGKTLPYLTPTIAAMVGFQRLTGMRPGEVELMRAIYLDRTDPFCWSYRPARHKGQHHGRDRVVFLGPQAQVLIRPFLTFDLMTYLFSPRRSVEQYRAEVRARRRSPVTPSQSRRRPKPDPKRTHGQLYDDGAYRKAIRKACLKAGVAIWSPNQLRHTAATEFRRLYGLEASQALLGHSELGTTQIYAEVDRSTAHRLMAEIG